MRTIHRKIKQVTATRKGKIIGLSVLLVIMIAIGGAVFYWNIYRKQILRTTLEDTVRNKSEGLYSIKYDSLNLDEIAGNLRLTNLRLAYDSAKYLALVAKNTPPPTLLKIIIPELIVTGVKTPRALLNQEILGKKLLITKPVIEIIYTNAGKDSARNIPTLEVYKQILGDMNQIQVDTVEISGAQITTTNIKNGSKNLDINNAFIRLLNVNIDENTGRDSSQLLFARELYFTCGKFFWPSKDKLYNYSVDNVTLNSATKEITVKQLRMDPTLNEDAFVKSLPFQDDRFDISINDIRIRNADFYQLFNENILADSILAGSASFKIYRDQTRKRQNKNKVGTYPHQRLDDIPVSFQVKKLILANAFLEFKEKSSITSMQGKLQFHNTYAVISNLTNNKEAIRANNIMTASISSQFLNKAPIKVVWTFYLQNPKGRFDVKGNLGSISAADINSITQPLGPAKLENGRIHSLEFDLKGNNYQTNGTVKMLYEDLKISILEMEKDSHELDKKTLASLAANFIIKDENPRKKDDPRIATVHFDRDVNRSIFHLVWKSIFKGIRETVGIKK
ncbi:MAG: hypothetical protein ACSLE0_17655 [Chitinophagaceae bacterium]